MNFKGVLATTLVDPGGRQFSLECLQIATQFGRSRIGPRGIYADFNPNFRVGWVSAYSLTPTKAGLRGLVTDPFKAIAYFTIEVVGSINDLWLDPVMPKKYLAIGGAFREVAGAISGTTIIHELTNPIIGLVDVNIDSAVTPIEAYELPPRIPMMISGARPKQRSQITLGPKSRR